MGMEVSMWATRRAATIGIRPASDGGSFGLAVLRWWLETLVAPLPSQVTEQTWHIDIQTLHQNYSLSVCATSTTTLQVQIIQTMNEMSIKFTFSSIYMNLIKAQLKGKKKIFFYQRYNKTVPKCECNHGNCKELTK